MFIGEIYKRLLIGELKRRTLIWTNRIAGLIPEIQLGLVLIGQTECYGFIGEIN